MIKRKTDGTSEKNVDIISKQDALENRRLAGQTS